jgi:hypothetical protein
LNSATANFLTLALNPADDQTPIFARDRPLSININDHEVGDLNAASIVGPNWIFTTAIDYIYTKTQLVFNQFDKQQNSIYNELDPRYHLMGYISLEVYSQVVNLATVRNMSEAANPSSNSNCSHKALSTWLLLHHVGRSVWNLEYSGFQLSRDTCSSVRRKGPKYR